MKSIKNRVVWTEIPVTDMGRAKAFYEQLLGAPLTPRQAGPDEVQVLPSDEAGGVLGQLFAGKPAPNGTGPTIHLAVSIGLEEAMERIRAGGGEVVSEVIEIPAGRFFYARDTEGNSVGCFNG